MNLTEFQYLYHKSISMAIGVNPLLSGLSGKISDIIVKQYDGKTVVTAVPDMSGRKLSKKQKDNNDLMSKATRVAKSITARPRLKERACDILEVPPNKVFRAIIKNYMLTDGQGLLFEESQQETEDKETLVSLKTIITTDIPGAELFLFGDRAKGAYDDRSDWDILILTTNSIPNARKWELQEKLTEVTIQKGSRVNILLAQKTKWHTEPEFEMIRTRIENELLPVKEVIGKRY